ncbi:MAG: flagellar basal-body MS-ring/collar protein FliF [Caulobacterales bacterium]
MDGVFRIFAQAGPTRLLAALGVTGVVAALLFSIMFRMDGAGKTLLFSGLDPAEASSITARLDATGVKYELRGDGSAIYVDDQKALKARMMLAGEGLPSRGSVGYEIFDKSDSLGANTFVQNINKLRALEGELSRTVMALDGVTDARVHLVLPERRLFENEQNKASASIVLRTRSGTLDPQAVRAVRNLVASAVPGLDVNRVTLVDEHGRLLAAGAEDSNAAEGNVAERQGQVEERLRKAVADIVENIAGPGAARVQVSADLDLNRVTQASETFDPDGQVVRSTQSVEESGQNSDGAGANGGVSAANNVPGGTSADASTGGGGNQSANNRTEETVNYEISKTTKTEVFESGAIKRLSVAVAVDDLAKVGADGKSTYTPRTPEEMQRIEALVKSAIGFDEKRGDIVQVVNIGFSRPAEMGPPPKAPMMGLEKGDFFRIGEMAIMAFAALALIFFVLRPLVGGLLMGGAGSAAGGGMAAIAGPNGAAIAAMPAGAEGGAPGLPAPGPTSVARTSAAIQAALDNQTPNKIDETIGVAKVQGEIKASSVKRVAEVIDGHPDESISILRNWIHEPG